MLGLENYRPYTTVPDDRIIETPLEIVPLFFCSNPKLERV